MTLEIDPPLLKRTTSYEQWKLETKAWTMITGISTEKQAIIVALFYQIMKAESKRKCLNNSSQRNSKRKVG